MHDRGSMWSTADSWLTINPFDPRQPLRSHLHRRVEARQALTGGAPTRFPEAQPESELSPRGHRRQADDNSQALWTAGPRGSGYDTPSFQRNEPRRAALAQALTACSSTGLCQPLPIEPIEPIEVHRGEIIVRAGRKILWLEGSASRVVCARSS